MITCVAKNCSPTSNRFVATVKITKCKKFDLEYQGQGDINNQTKIWLPRIFCQHWHCVKNDFSEYYNFVAAQYTLQLKKFDLENEGQEHPMTRLKTDNFKLSLKLS